MQSITFRHGYPMTERLFCFAVFLSYCPWGVPPMSVGAFSPLAWCGSSRCRGWWYSSLGTDRRIRRVGRDRVSAFHTYLNIKDFRLRSAGAAVGIYDRGEILTDQGKEAWRTRSRQISNRMRSLMAMLTGQNTVADLIRADAFVGDIPRMLASLRTSGLIVDLPSTGAQPSPLAKRAAHDPPAAGSIGPRGPGQGAHARLHPNHAGVLPRQGADRFRRGPGDRARSGRRARHRLRVAGAP